jgi:hypothetical protein
MVFLLEYSSLLDRKLCYDVTAIMLCQASLILDAIIIMNIFSQACYNLYISSCARSSSLLLLVRRDNIVI